MTQRPLVALGWAIILSACSKSGGSAPAPPPARPVGQLAVPLAPTDCTADFPQLPLSELPPANRNEFCRFATDNLCYCGCPHTIAGCLKEHPTCHHATRAALLGLFQIAGPSGTAESAAKAVAAYYESFKVENRVALPVGMLPCQGPANAKLTMVEFSDFDCPHCKAAKPLFEQLVKSRHDLKLCFASFPLHAHSSLAAEAALYAQGKGAFWRFQDLLFEAQEERATLDESAYITELVRLAGKAGLDGAALRTALTGPDLKMQVDAETEFAHKLGLDGTPSVYVNGRFVPPFSAELYQLTFEDELEWIGNDSHWARD